MENDNSTEVHKLAAEAIKNADILILATGAGFSADSGLAVYKDIADVEAYHKQNLTYMDLCDPRWISDDPDIFYGFWGSCFNSYRDTKPHKGYAIIRNWKSKFFEKLYLKKKIQNLSRECSHQTHTEELSWMDALNEKMQNLHFDEKPLDEYPGAFFVYTSNVDNHTFSSGLAEESMIEIHGTTENWQCSEPCKDVFWKAPSDFKFEVDMKTMRAPNKDSQCKEKGFTTNHPTCIYCGKLARPSVLMFCDGSWVNHPIQRGVYYGWRDAVHKLLTNEPTLKLTILEIGCGMNVPTVRCQSEMYLEELKDKCTLIRINPDFPLYKGEGNVISIKSKGLEALEKIDSFLQ